jgi:hypothetical protein
MENTSLPEVNDGPIDKGRWWKAAPRKIMHLLKQPTEINESFTALIQEIHAKSEDMPRFFRPIAERSIAIQDLKRSWKSIEGAKPSELWEALLTSAIVNLDNAHISLRTPIESLSGMAKGNFDRWHNQICLCKPTVVLCGGNYDAVIEAFPDGHKPVHNKATTGMKYFIDPLVDGCIYLEAPHPSCFSIPRRMVHAYLTLSAREILPN